jgi:hypothetical protein
MENAKVKGQLNSFINIKIEWKTFSNATKGVHKFKDEGIK